MLEGNIIKSNTNYLVTKAQDSIYVLIHNNANLKRDYGNKMGSDVCKQVNTLDIICNLKLINLLPGNYQVTTYTVCEDNNPKYVAELLNINQYLLPTDVEYLKQTCNLTAQHQFSTIDDNFTNQILIKNNEVVLYKLKILSKK